MNGSLRQQAQRRDLVWAKGVVRLCFCEEVTTYLIGQANGNKKDGDVRFDSVDCSQNDHKLHAFQVIRRDICNY